MLNVRKINAAKPVKRRPDRRVGRTRARLGQALRKLMEERPLEKISVQDVIELAGVSRSAFYAHYDDKVDLLLSDMDEFLERMATLLVVRNEQSNRIAPVHEFFTHVGEAVEIRAALARSERLQDFFDLAVDHFARGIELRLKQIAERETAPPQRCSGGIAAAARSDLIAHALAGAFVGFLNAWTRKGQPHAAAAMDTLFHELAWAGIRNLQGRKSENQGQVLKYSTFR
jgi:AcrR family transcriptional regulator